MLTVFVVLVIGFVLLLTLGCCKVSGDCSREEELRDSMKCCRHCVPPKRYPGCHDHCPEYAEERAEYDEKKAAADKKKAVAQGIYKQKSDSVNRAFKKHGRK